MIGCKRKLWVGGGGPPRAGMREGEGVRSRAGGSSSFSSGILRGPKRNAGGREQSGGLSQLSGNEVGVFWGTHFTTTMNHPGQLPDHVRFLMFLDHPQLPPHM